MRTLIYGGLLIDPASKVCSAQDILIEDGRVSQILPAGSGRNYLYGKAAPAEDTVIDAAGRVVCPGFIDIHMHEDPIGEDGRIQLDEDTAVLNCMLRMGVTTAIGGNCGSNVCDPVRYLQTVDRDGAPVNVGLFAGHNFYRAQAGCTEKYAPATAEQILRIGQGVREALDGGCLGVSYGIRYAPGMNLEEMLASAKESTLVAAHIRDDAAEVFAAAQEFLELGRRLGVRMQVSHIGSMAGFGQMEEFLAMLERERANGLDVACDCYPYDAFCTEIGATTYDDGWMERYRCGYEAVEACEGRYKGQRLTKERFEEMRREDPNALTVAHVMKSHEIEMALTAPGVMLGSDGILDRGQGHPRAAGAFPRLVASYVRTGKMSLYDAVARMTAMPAARIGLERKGRLSVGADADLVIFNPDVIADRATFSCPTAAPVGIDYVQIGGRTALRAGRIVQGRLGRAVRG